MNIALHWFRMDLRLTDNTALNAAVKEHDQVWPVFIFDPKTLSAPDMGAPRARFLLDALEALEKNLAVAGVQLVIRDGPVIGELQKLILETSASSVYFNREYEPYAMRRDGLVEETLQRQGVKVKSYKDSVLLEPNEVLKSDGMPYTVFTAYARAWRTKIGVRSAPSPQWKDPKRVQISSIPMPTLEQLKFTLSATLQHGGERAGLERLKKFINQGMVQYKSQRDYPAIDGTSQLSADLRCGTVSPRQIYLAAQQKAADAPTDVDCYVNELVWRDFYRSILWHFPHVEKGCFKPLYDGLAWENNEGYFQAWCAGQTGVPIVDAGMRQLNQTGWMHNRLRMIVASYLTKDLLIDWKWGEKYFMQKLVDADLASNNGGWQWSASTGTDAQPYFRIFNPCSQAAKFDPKGTFVETYVPEVKSPSYPRPVVDHAVQRGKALKLFKDPLAQAMPKHPG